MGLISFGIKTTKTTPEEFMGKIHFNDGNIGSVSTDTSSSTLVIERNPSRENLIITNIGSEVIYLYRKNYASQAEADAEVARGNGIPLYAQGTNETWDNEFLWTGDVWVSTSTASQVLTFDEK